jgi:hypothetical protein
VLSGIPPGSVAALQLQQELVVPGFEKWGEGQGGFWVLCYTESGMWGRRFADQLSPVAAATVRAGGPRAAAPGCRSNRRPTSQRRCPGWPGKGMWSRTPVRQRNEIRGRAAGQRGARVVGAACMGRSRSGAGGKIMVNAPGNFPFQFS